MRRKLLKTDIARGLGISKSRVAQLEAQGMPVNSLEASKAWRAANCDPDRVKPAPGAADAPANDPAGDPVIRSWRDRLIRANARIREFELARDRGDYLQRGDVLAGWEHNFATFRARMLAIPSRIAGQVSPSPARDETLRVVADEIHAALTELSGGADPAPRTARGNGEARE